MKYSVRFIISITLHSTCVALTFLCLQNLQLVHVQWKSCRELLYTYHPTFNFMIIVLWLSRQINVSSFSFRNFSISDSQHYTHQHTCTNIFCRVCVDHSYAIYEAVRFQLSHFSFDDCENTCILSYHRYHTGNMYLWSFLRVKSWNTDTHCVHYCYFK